ncbi:bifunctional metallophosphatase/5'-nucleotidase [Filimonas effusa]|uniref:Bifunctional metallophosphatase/5'-nucleotidase n=1 Tax=Filimonas effusa TaxID=2508721 RepID=A0A4Q1D0H1_9BACT|nr:metallophosphatase [Filimonas effusa]RXK81243.1 bifunctional metallophosphatase/5'-nucleotidase [Filimonas effusa]
MLSDRRKFIRQSVLAGGAVFASGLLPGIARAAPAGNNITILHTNDVHSRLDPFPMDGGKYQGLGGVANRATLISQIRKEEEHVLLLDAGDIFQGTPYFNVYKGEPEIKAMSRMQYDAVTMGNHDFDGGIENFATQLQHASFPVLVCNYDFTGTAMEGKSLPYKVFEKAGLKIGVLGVGIELQGLVPENLYGKTVYSDPITAANTNANILRRKEGCDMVICLSHLGDKYDDGKISDEILAKESYDIDLIIGGHTHRFFAQPRSYKNRSNADVIVNQVGWAGIQLGRLDFNLDRGKKKNLVKANTVVIGEKARD